MKPIKEGITGSCIYRMQHSDHMGKTYKSICGKPATHCEGSYLFCRHHSKTGRYVIRMGDTGEIVARFDTEKELHDNIHLYPKHRMQKVTKSSRRDIYPKQ